MNEFSKVVLDLEYCINYNPLKIMKNIVSKLFLPVVFSIFLFAGCEKSGSDEYPDLLFFTENYKPLNYVENGNLFGLAPDILKEICKETKIPFNVSVKQWDEAYEIVQNTNNAVLFSTVLESERVNLFKWAGPIASLDWVFYSKPQSNIKLTYLNDAKSVAKIGVIADYSIEQFLVDEGFTNLVYCSSNVDAFTKLLNGEIDLFPSDMITAEAALKTMNKTIYSVKELLLIKTDLVYIAFNKSISDDVVERFQFEIDRMKNNGQLLALYRKHMGSNDFPGTLQIYTEQYSPLSFRNSNGDITGLGTDIVKEIMKRNNIFADIKLSSWSNGYQLALINPNFCLFTMDKTELRTNLFKWVGPLGANTTWIYTKKESGITLNSLAQAKALTSIGTVNSWFSDQYLRQQGFTNLVSENDPDIIVKKFMNGEVQAFVCSSVTFPSILKGLGYEMNSVNASYSLMSSDYYIAFSKSTPQLMVDKWQTALDGMKNDGTYNAIMQKWLE